LIDVDMGALGGLLNPNKLKMQSKGVQSVVSRVTNLNKLSPQITHDSLTEKIIHSFLKHYGAEVSLRTLNPAGPWDSQTRPLDASKTLT
jgi:lipoate-protein ligase A